MLNSGPQIFPDDLFLQKCQLNVNETKVLLVEWLTRDFNLLREACNSVICLWWLQCRI